MKPGWDPYAAALAALDDWEATHGKWPTEQLIKCARANHALQQSAQRLADTIRILNAAPRIHTNGKVQITLTQERMIEAASALGQWERTQKEHQQ